jgi:hypothetical protein
MRYAVVFEDGKVRHVTNHCEACGHKVDKALIQVSLERLNKVLCWPCIQLKAKRMFGIDLPTPRFLIV